MTRHFLLLRDDTKRIVITYTKAVKETNGKELGIVPSKGFYILQGNILANRVPFKRPVFCLILWFTFRL